MHPAISAAVVKLPNLRSSKGPAIAGRNNTADAYKELFVKCITERNAMTNTAYILLNDIIRLFDNNRFM